MESFGRPSGLALLPVAIVEGGPEVDPHLVELDSLEQGLVGILADSPG